MPNVEWSQYHNCFFSLEEVYDAKLFHICTWYDWSLNIHFTLIKITPFQDLITELPLQCHHNSNKGSNDHIHT